MKCKHLHALDYALKKGLVKDTDKLPAEAKRESKSYTEDDYSF